MTDSLFPNAIPVTLGIGGDKIGTAQTWWEGDALRGEVALDKPLPEGEVSGISIHVPPPNTHNKVRRAVGSVLFNASNFPERAQIGIWGADMGPLNEKITDAVLKALEESDE